MVYDEDLRAFFVPELLTGTTPVFFIYFQDSWPAETPFHQVIFISTTRG
jgi:hypothetical protein